MTKRALIIIAVLMILPVLVVIDRYKDWKTKNETVAEYGESVDEVIYGEKKLLKVEGSDEYIFRPGKYLGKVGDRYFGTQLYLLRDDESDGYYVMAGNDGYVLMNESGKMTDGLRRQSSSITRAIIDDYASYTDDADEIKLLTGGYGLDRGFTFTPSDYGEGEYSEFTVGVCFDGSAVSTEKICRFIFIKEKNKWIRLEERDVADAETALENGETDKLSVPGKEVGSPGLMKLLSKMALGKNDAVTTGSADAEAAG